MNIPEYLYRIKIRENIPENGFIFRKSDWKKNILQAPYVQDLDVFSLFMQSVMPEVEAVKQKTRTEYSKFFKSNVDTHRTFKSSMHTNAAGVYFEYPL